MAATAVSSNHAAFPESPGILPSMACRHTLLRIPDPKAGHHGPTHPDRTGSAAPSRRRDPRCGPPRGVRRRPRLGRPVPNRSRHLVGWHVHPGHDTHDTYVFQTEGRLRLEFGPGGTQSVEGGPGDFVLIPKGVVHREGNPGTEPNEAIVFRVGEGEVLVNLDSP